MKIRIYRTRNPDTRKTVFHWVITFAGQWAAGGYCATRADARNDASIVAASLRRTPAPCSFAAAPELYAALENILEHRERMGLGSDHVYEAARAALAKATS